MEVRNRIFFILLIKLIILITKSSSNDVFGCGGFIKSHADIDFSKVEIKLLTKQGSLKDKTDCSPSNGYYFIPVYDKGEYILKVSPPSGWSFEPEQFGINFDGKTDLCSLGKDINFDFKGFGITGQVNILNQKTGAKGVRIDLTSLNRSDKRHTHSDKNGIFEFTPVVPGKYVLKASHDRWSFSKAEHTVSVETGNTELPINSLLVSGFYVQGKVVSDGQPFKNVNVALFPLKSQKSFSDCKASDQTILQEQHKNYEALPICVGITGNNGEYAFTSISPGKYLVKPYFQSQNIKYHVKPDVIEMEVLNDGILIEENFEITGFDVFGRVLTSKDGKGVAGAKIKLNGNIAATTFANGSYVLQNIKPGIFTIQVTAENMEFTDHTVKISPTNPSIPDIIVSAFKICGQVVSENSHTVSLTRQASTFHTTVQTSLPSGEWCSYLSNGRYTIEVLINNEDHLNGVQFFPLAHEIEVNSSPSSGITFSQLRAKVSGDVKCLPDADNSCKQITIILNSVDSTGNLNRQYKSTELNQGKYSFEDVLPGNYEVLVSQTAQPLCWENQKYKLTVKSAIEKVPTFVQSGYSISIVSTHRTEMTYKLKSAEPTTQAKTLDLSAGLTQFCVLKSGTYDMKFSGCHTYDSQTPSTFSTKSNAPITVTAAKHRNGIRILSEDKTNYQMIVEYSERQETVTLQEERDKVDGYHSYIYIFNLKYEEELKLIPKSDHMLFKPETKEIIAGNDCVDIAFSFIATKGLVINGKIEPQIEGATVTLSFPKNPEIESIITSSNKKGEFRFGPIDSSIDVDIVAEKESYVFSAFDKNLKLFKAHKLCEIIATIKDERGQKLPGVLLSLSGGESYRKNLVTGDDGTIKFHSLSPSEYYLRPMMKEYKFDPSSKMIEVKDGTTAVVELTGKRVAYSAFGQIVSLNGEPFSNVIIEAVSIPDEKCSEHQEESTTEVNGHYRIRGLRPGCHYNVQIKSVDVNSIVDRSIPLKRTILVEDDVKDVNIIGISPIGFVDVIARVYASQNDFYKTLRIQMYRKGNSESPVYSQRVESPLNAKSKINPGIMIFFPRIPLDGKIYYIEITSTLSDKSYKYTAPSTQFIANISSVFVELDFKPEVRTSENDLNQNSLSALLLIGIIALVFFRQELALEILNIVWIKLNNIIQDLINTNRKKEVQRVDYVVDDNEIEQLAQSINSVKKKKSRKIN